MKQMFWWVHAYARLHIIDPCVYMKHVSDTSFGLILLVLYVDDMFIAAKDRFEIIKLKVQLSFEFNMKDLVLAKRILVMKIRRN